MDQICQQLLAFMPWLSKDLLQLALFIFQCFNPTVFDMYMLYKTYICCFCNFIVFFLMFYSFLKLNRVGFFSLSTFAFHFLYHNVDFGIYFKSAALYLCWKWLRSSDDFEQKFLQICIICHVKLHHTNSTLQSLRTILFYVESLDDCVLKALFFRINTLRHMW